MNLNHAIKFRIFTLILTLAFIFPAGNIYAQSEILNAKKAVIDEFHKQMAKHKIVGGALVVIQPGETIIEEHYGTGNQGKNIPANENTVYCWGSVTKTLTSIAIMQLHLREKLDITDPFIDYIPAFRRIENPYHNTPMISIKMLMSHTAGLQSASFIVPFSTFKPGPQWEQIEAVMEYIKVLHRPGTLYKYSNLSLMLVGRLIDEVTLDEYEVYMDKNIYKPLEMFDSYYDTTPYHLLPVKAQGYFAYEEGKERKLYHPDYDQGVTTSNGGLKCPVKDMKKYALFLLGSEDSEIQKRYDGVLPRKVLKSMWEPVHPFENAESGSIGLGFHIYTDLKHKYIGHGGSGNGFRCEIMFDPESKTAFFMVGNTENVGDVHKEVKKVIDEKLMPLLRTQDKF